jgi:serine/threonine protein phosphatase PrpC
MTLTLRAAAGSDIGRRRRLNQDSACASPRLLAVADGMGGHAHGEVASAIAIGTLVELDRGFAAGDLAEVDLVGALGAAVADVARRLTEAARQDPELGGTGTTLVAMLVDGERIGTAHVGDSRIYLLRDGQLQRLTHDHTFVQALVDEGRLSEEEAAEHPRRSVLVRTLQEGVAPEPDLFEVEGRAGDRFLLCSDGVTAVLDDAEIHRALLDGEPRDVVDRMIALADDGGGPDNITCVVADLVEGRDGEADEPVVVGAVADQV